MLPSTRQATADLHLHGRLSNTNRLSAVFKATNNVANVGRREEESKGKEQEENQPTSLYHLRPKGKTHRRAQTFDNWELTSGCCTSDVMLAGPLDATGYCPVGLQSYVLLKQASEALAVQTHCPLKNI